MEKKISIRLNEELHKEFRILCINLGISMNQFIIEAIEKKLSEEKEKK